MQQACSWAEATQLGQLAPWRSDWQPGRTLAAPAAMAPADRHSGPQAVHEGDRTRALAGVGSSTHISLLLLAHRWSRPGCFKPKLLQQLSDRHPSIRLLPEFQLCQLDLDFLLQSSQSLTGPLPQAPSLRTRNQRAGTQRPTGTTRSLTTTDSTASAGTSSPPAARLWQRLCSERPQRACCFLPPPSPLPLPFLKASVPTSTHQVLVSPRGPQSPWRPRIFRGSEGTQLQLTLCKGILGASYYSRPFYAETQASTVRCRECYHVRAPSDR